MIDRTALLADARALTGRLVEDLRVRTERDEESLIAVRGTYDRAVSAGRTDKTYEEWREDLLAQVAAGWVLAGVFVRFCEDNGLVDTPLLSGPGAALDRARDHRAEFFAADATAGDREWLVEVYRRYQRIPAAAEIFGDRNPLWQLAPSADGSRDILELWWALDADGRETRHDFTDPELDTRFLGDLYQDLSEHARKQYALLQTPDFVEAFILDRTLDPAIEEFGLAEVTMIDPTCGSGHFLLGAFHRLLARWREREPGTGGRELVQRALDAVHGVDVNPFAVEIARFRLLVAALRAAGERRLEDLPAFRLNLAVGDSLLHGTRPGSLLSGAAEFAGVLRHHYPTEDADAAERILAADSYHAVVGNPPYITVKDAALNNVYRGLYASCHRQYSLAVPFKERFFQLAVHGNGERPAGFVGMITANSFMKREFGKRVIEGFLPQVDLTHVIDTSGAYIPGHGTPTVILLGRDRPPVGDTVRAVLGIRGEPGRPDDPASGLVWSSIRDLVDKPGAENDFISVDDVERDRFESHPWSLQGGAAPTVAVALEEAAGLRLRQTAKEVGFGAVTREDDAFRIGTDVALRHRVEVQHVRPLICGGGGQRLVHPLVGGGDLALLARPPWCRGEADEGLVRLLWPFRAQLSDRVAYLRENATGTRAPVVGILDVLRQAVSDAVVDRVCVCGDAQPLRAGPGREGVQPVGAGDQVAGGGGGGRASGAARVAELLDGVLLDEGGVPQEDSDGRRRGVGGGAVHASARVRLDEAEAVPAARRPAAGAGAGAGRGGAAVGRGAAGRGRRAGAADAVRPRRCRGGGDGAAPADGHAAGGARLALLPAVRAGQR